METEDDRAWLEELLEDCDLTGNHQGKDDISRGSNGLLNPNAAVFVPRNNNLSVNCPRVRADGDLQDQNFHLADQVANPLATSPANPPIDLDTVDNPDGETDEQKDESNPDEVINRQKNANNESADVRREHQNDAETRNRLQAIIQASQHQAERACLAYIRLYGAGQNVAAGDDHRNRLKNNQHAILSENSAGDRQRFRHNQAGAVAHNRGRTRGQFYDYSRQERDYDEKSSVMGPIRDRRGGRNQQERDAAYWRGRFYQLRNQNRKVKDFLFRDKF